MDTTMVLRVAGVCFIALGLVFLVLMYVFGIRKANLDFFPNPSLAVGTVIGGSPICYGNHPTARVRYEVDGKEYVVSGPLFEYGTAGPVKSNLTTRASLPAKLRAPGGVGFSHDVYIKSYPLSCIAKLCPIGSECDVWYDPSDPSRAYVERPIRRGLLATVMFGGLAAALLSVGALFLML